MVMELWICADWDSSRADEGKGREGGCAAAHTQQKPQFHPGAALAHRVCPTGAFVSFAGHRILKETCWKIPKKL